MYYMYEVKSFLFKLKKRKKEKNLNKFLQFIYYQRNDV